MYKSESNMSNFSPPDRERVGRYVRVKSELHCTINKKYEKVKKIFFSGNHSYSLQAKKDGKDEISQLPNTQSVI